jgi:hypothetical protein
MPVAQTLGIPVGPVSDLISELLGVALDIKLAGLRPALPVSESSLALIERKGISLLSD